ncbi:MAG: hypothetical protein IH586_19805 [Anaerolineaceae bacterium]|nr:hypothetical protein [Anaerolineaceae bacterium]
MERRKTISLLIVGTLSILAVVGLLTYRTVYAQSTSPTPAVPAPEDQKQGPGREMRGGLREGTSDQDLATALGIDLTKLQEAQKTAAAEALKQAVSDGLITQKQADQFSSGNMRGGFPGGMGWLAQNGIDENALLAKALGITPDELQAARQKAVDAKIDSAVASGSMTQEQADLIKGRQALYADQKFQAGMQSAYEANIQQAVKDGVITQAQADQILKQGNIFTGRGGFEGPGFGPHGRHGGWKGGAPVPPQTNSTN